MKRIEETAEVWESGELGCDEKYVEKVEISETLIDDAMELKAISIRMQKGLIDDLKDIARIKGLGYQPLIKQILSRFVEAEKKQALREKACQAMSDDQELELDEHFQKACGH